MPSLDGKFWHCILLQVGQTVLAMSLIHAVTQRQAPSLDAAAGFEMVVLGMEAPAHRPTNGMMLGVRCCVHTESALGG